MFGPKSVNNILCLQNVFTFTFDTVIQIENTNKNKNMTLTSVKSIHLAPINIYNWRENYIIWSFHEAKHKSKYSLSLVIIHYTEDLNSFNNFCFLFTISIFSLKDLPSWKFKELISIKLCVAWFFY